MFESSITDDVREKYILLPLDTFHFKAAGRTEVAYCLIENTPIMEMMYVDRYRDLHNNLVRNYHERNWNYCEDALEHLKGRWGGEVDSFYELLERRIQDLKQVVVDESWTGIIDRD